MRFTLDDNTGPQAGPRDAAAALDSSPTPNALPHRTPQQGVPETGLLSIRRDGEVYRARLNDGALRTLDAGKLRTEIAALNHPGGRPPVLVLSLRNMDSLASGCLSSLAQVSTDLERIGGALVIYAVPREVARMLKRTKLDRLIHTAKERGAAKKRALALAKKNTNEQRRFFAA